MDDLKVYEEDKDSMDETARVVEEVSGAMGMTLGLQKCATAHASRGRVVTRGETELPTGNTIEEVQYGQTYKYLGVEQLMGADLVRVRQSITKEYLRRVRKTWKSKLSRNNKVKLHNTWCTAVLRYVAWDSGETDSTVGNVLQILLWSHKVAPDQSCGHGQKNQGDLGQEQGPLLPSCKGTFVPSPETKAEETWTMWS